MGRALFFILIFYFLIFSHFFSFSLFYIDEWSSTEERLILFIYLFIYIYFFMAYLPFSKQNEKEKDKEKKETEGGWQGGTTPSSLSRSNSSSNLSIFDKERVNRRGILILFLVFSFLFFFNALSSRLFLTESKYEGVSKEKPPRFRDLDEDQIVICRGLRQFGGKEGGNYKEWSS